MSPYDAPGTYSLLQYTELAEGIFYPVGGFHVVLSSLASIAAHFGATFRLSTPVSRVLISPDGTASGVELASGAFLNADAVILNCDLVHAYTNLLPPSPEARALQNRHHSCSSISFYWSLNRKVPALTTHNIFLASEYRDSFDAIFNRQEMPKDPSFYVNVPSRIDPTAAPENGDAITVLVPIGHLTGEGDQPKIANMVEKARRWVLQTVKLRTGEDLRDAIIDEQINTPFTCNCPFSVPTYLSHTDPHQGKKHST